MGENAIFQCEGKDYDGAITFLKGFVAGRAKKKGLSNREVCFEGLMTSYEQRLVDIGKRRKIEPPTVDATPLPKLTRQ